MLLSHHWRFSPLAIISIVTLRISLTGAVFVSYSDCAHGEIESISIEPCWSHPCHFEQGARANLTIVFTPSREATDVRIYSTLRRGGFFDYEVVVHDEDPMVCRSGNSPRDWGKLECPLKPGTKYTFVASRLFPVSTRYNIFRYSKIKLLDKYGSVVACADWYLQFERLRAF